MEFLINAVMARPLIFDKSEHDYMDKELRREAFQEIADHLNKQNCSNKRITGDCVQRTWEKLYERFKQADNLEKSGKSGDAAVKHDFPYMEEMSFLRPYMAPRSFYSNRNLHQQPSTSKQADFIDAFLNDELSVPTSQTFDNEFDSLFKAKPKISRKRMPPCDDSSVKKKRKIDSELKLVAEGITEALDNVKMNLHEKQAAHNNDNEEKTMKNSKSSLFESYMAILKKAFSKIRPGEEVDCLMYVLEKLNE